MDTEQGLLKKFKEAARDCEVFMSALEDERRKSDKLSKKVKSLEKEIFYFKNKFHSFK